MSRNISFEPLLQPSQKTANGNLEELPTYLWQPITFKCNAAIWLVLQLVQKIIQCGIRLVLRPRSGTVGNLDIKEVESVYSREASSYDWKHHMTTRGMDTVWRRWAAWQTYLVAQQKRTKLKIVDLCTGTGLTIQEIVALLTERNCHAEIIGLDYNQAMLDRARVRSITTETCNVRFLRANAMDLVDLGGKSADLHHLPDSTADVVTQVFGIGGIDKPCKVFRGVLDILVPNGQYILIDMHQPIPQQPGEWPFLFRWWQMPLFEMKTYRHTTIPLALERLWGWRDTTLDFYLAPLVVRCAAGKCWGFDVIHFNVESERWWFGLPVMPTARLILQKREITHVEACSRERLCEAIQSAKQTA